ncbi:probable E3 ubiquitin-protein ligase HERC6 [Protopterus annectens]|uniref:probable E3 ubiquitin-protein ligase HERC6 n=1 Tax=Protopterus annectens TaxID=7888 RepID=UPI001CFB028C|nr:probable E3 ubiquitin-protein ligase HERC6 [Protopterus annectens]
MLYCWGDNTNGQLGLEQVTTLASTPTKWDYFQRKQLRAVGCGERHTLFLSSDGLVFSCGANEQGQCGRRDATRIAQIQALETFKILHVACGKEHSLAICDQGDVFAWGCGSNGQLGLAETKTVHIPKKIKEFSSIHVIQIACGHHHSVALSKDGRVFSWGQNNHGQLGLGKGISTQATPVQLKFLSGLPLAQIAAGGAHSFALSLSGTVFGWGNNNAGQLGVGTGTKAVYFKPCLVAEMKKIGVSFISCGQDHTAVLTKDGSVYTCGDGIYGQLGHGSKTNEYSPRKVELPDGKISQLTCGSHHTVVYIRDSDMVISFGHGTLGQLGSGTLCNEAHPLTVIPTGSNDADESSLTTDFKNATVKIIFAGMNVNFIQTLTSQEMADADSFPVSLLQIPKITASSVEQWLAVRDGSQEMIHAEREIASIFSSCAAINASFLKLRTPDSLEVCSADLGVDLQAARRTLCKLTEKTWIANKIRFSLQQQLIPALLETPPHKEACTIFLVLPECPVMQNNLYCQSLIMPFAQAIAKLSPPRIIAKAWSSLPPSSLNKQVMMFKQTVVDLMQTWHSTPQQNNDMKTLLRVLKLLYKANAKAQSPIPLKKFYIKEIPRYCNFLVDLVKWRWWQKQPESVNEDTVPFILCRFPFILDLVAKVNVLHVDAVLKQLTAEEQIIRSFNYELIQGNCPSLPELPVFYLKVNKKNIIESTLRQLNVAEDSHFRKRLEVDFVEEEGLNQRQEFFLYVFEELVQQNNELFTFLDNDTVIWFPAERSREVPYKLWRSNLSHLKWGTTNEKTIYAKPSDEKKIYYLFGILCGLALYNCCIVYLPFPLALFKKLLDIKPTFEDFKTMDPNYGRSLQYLLDYSCDNFEENFTIFFEASWDETVAELVPGGKSKPVTNANKKKYVDAFVDYVFNTSVKTIFEEFKRGFYKVCDREIVELFQPEELIEIMSGNADYDWDILRKNADYRGEYHPKHTTIKMFWKVFHELLLKEKKDFLLFLTGNSRIPVTGMDSVKIEISSFNPVSPLSTDHLPEARTCFNLLLLPKYETEEILKEKLLRAIEYNRGLFRD